MKNVFVSNLLGMSPVGQSVELYGWLINRRMNGKVTFLDVGDSTGHIQAVIESGRLSSAESEEAIKVSCESGIRVVGELCKGKQGRNEIRATAFETIGRATLGLTPQPRRSFDIFDPRWNSQMLDYRHIYLRNPKVMAILRFRSILMSVVREWFEANGFLEFDAPILTPAPLYDGRTAMPINVHGQDLYLSQCAGFYLEAAAHAFERVYNMGPSFRGEESRSKRHLMEYWHIKAELAWGDREDIMKVVEDILGYTIRECQKRAEDILRVLETDVCLDGLKVPFPRISYEEAVKHLITHGYSAKFGEALSTAEEEELSKMFDAPFWIVGIPRSVEPFPYVIDKDDPRITRVADLIASRGCGELLGVAEKIYDPGMLDERLKEKGKLDDARYDFVKDVHAAGCVPHIAFGMGLERLVRWLLGVEHVREAIPFPRVVRRRIHP
jgi:asparaginyl-tRNA synthetase